MSPHAEFRAVLAEQMAKARREAILATAIYLGRASLNLEHLADRLAVPGHDKAALAILDAAEQYAHAERTGRQP